MIDTDRFVPWKELLTCYSSIIFFPFLLFMFQGGTIFRFFSFSFENFIYILLFPSPIPPRFPQHVSYQLHAFVLLLLFVCFVCVFCFCFWDNLISSVSTARIHMNVGPSTGVWETYLQLHPQKIIILAPSDTIHCQKQLSHKGWGQRSSVLKCQRA